MLTGRRPEGGGGLTSEGASRSVLTSLNRQISGIFGEVGPGKGVAPGEEPSPLLGICLPCGLFEAGPQLVQERRSLPVRDHLQLGGDGGVDELAPAARRGGFGVGWRGEGVFDLLGERSGRQNRDAAGIGGSGLLFQVAAGGEEQ